MNSTREASQARVMRRDTGAMIWIVTYGTIVLWLIHVGVEISLAGHGRGRPWVPWVMNGLTVALALFSVLATWAAWRIVGRHQQDESHLSPDGRTAFLGWMGVFIGSCDVALIVVEGVYLVALHG